MFPSNPFKCDLLSLDKPAKLVSKSHNFFCAKLGLKY